MTKLTLEIFDDTVTTLNKLRDINDSGIELELPEGSILFENVLNLKLIKKLADKYGMTVHFTTEDPAGITLIEMIEEGRENVARTMELPLRETEEIYVPKASRKMPSTIALPLKAVKEKLKGLNVWSAIIPPVIISLLLVLLYHFEQNSHEAKVKLLINSQPLTKSITVKVKAGVPTNPEQKILAGTNVQDNIELTYETDTTGKKLVGDKAKGTAKIFNKTENDKVFKKGQVLVYDSEGTDYEFILDEEVEVPAATEDATDPGNPIPVYGEIEAAVTASGVGTAYNIEKNKALEVKGSKKSEFSAATSKDFTGGKSETIQVVSEADLAKIKAELDKQTPSKADEALKNKIANSQTLLSGSSKNTIVKDTPNHKVGDEEEKVASTRVVSVDGLVYLNDELNRFLDSITKEVVPEGFVLSSKDRDVSVDILGNSTNSVLSSTEADIQVTLKAFIVPDIAEDYIKEQIAGKSTAEAQEILGNVRNIKTFELNLNKGTIPIFNKVPKDIRKISVEIVKE